MVALAYSVLGDIHLSEDAVQEVFAIACRDLPSLKNRDKFGAWLGGICRNVARQMRRSKDKAAALNDSGSVAEERGGYADAVRQAVWRLRAVEREAIVLRYYDNMPYNQIAAVLGISAQAVHGRLTRAKRKIADYLRRDGFAGGSYEGG
jgi:RNA polymerase sigma-70 factor (ECF subfamily)